MLTTRVSVLAWAGTTHLQALPLPIRRKEHRRAVLWHEKTGGPEAGSRGPLAPSPCASLSHWGVVGQRLERLFSNARSDISGMWVALSDLTNKNTEHPVKYEF